ncbi:hypothetical protein GUB10_02680 [Salegentibacter sp. BLCTC]|uniref:hypothetical protein n=1 Tax=Salegentibacter sp. BLCTC TaxID=2697368 RepID=UPI00187B1562|nr:hypothetical protein [Salegentibacter sp. BLCTC]MBE7639227.1 hypothetical protein [Salegentibacter sp. BLCTC]
MRNALVTYIYPEAIKYFSDFIHAVENQTVNNFQVIIFNDGVENAELYFEKLLPKVEILNLDGSIAGIRFDSLQILKDSTFENLVFQDIDDMMSSNRIEVSLNYLNDYSLVCNDLDTFRNGEILKENVWKPRLGENFEFDHEFLIDKNIVGLGNTAIRKKLLEYEIKRSNLTIAVDWFIFYQLLCQYNKTAFFTGKCTTIYRQHQNNIAGLNNAKSVEKLLEILKVKSSHYLALNQIGLSFKAEVENTENLKNRIILNNKPLQFEADMEFLWWEETNDL